MFKKILKISVPILLIGVIVFYFLDKYQTIAGSTPSPITVIPTNASVILQLNDVKNLSKSLKLSNIWSKLQNIKQVEVITKKAEEISIFFNKNQAIFE